jgi:hypothetical protein
MKITIETDDLLDLLYCLGAKLGTLTASDIVALDEIGPFSKKFLLEAVGQEPVHNKTEDSIAQIETSAGTPIHMISEETWKELLQ